MASANAFGAITDDISRLETGFSQTSLDLVSVVGRLFENLKLVDASAKKLTTSSQTTVDSVGKLDKRIVTLENAPKVDEAMLARLGDMEKNIAEEANAIRENTLRDIAEGEKVTSLVTSVTSLAEQNRRLEGSLVELKNTVTSLVSTNSKLESRVESLEEALKAANSRNLELEETVESHWKQNTDQHGAHVQKFTSQEAEREASGALHFERLSNYRASEWERSLKYELGKVEITDSGAAELEILSSATESCLAAQAMYGVDFGEANAQALKSVVVSPAAADVLSLCGVLYVEVSSDSTRACAVGEHAVIGQIAENQLMTFPEKESTADLGMIGTKGMQDSAESVNALAGAVAEWISKASVSKIVLHGAIGCNAMYSQEEKLVRLGSGAGEPLNNVEQLAVAIIEKSNQQDMQVWLWPSGPSCQLQLKNDWKSLSRGLVINMSSDKVVGALDGQPLQYETEEHKQFSSQSVLAMRSREEIWRTAKTVVNRLSEMASKRPFKLVLTGALSMRLQKAAVMVDGDSSTDKFLHLFERLRELESLSVPGVDALEQGVIGELQNRLESNEVRIGEVDDAVRAQVPTLEALTDASRIDAIVDSKLEGLDIWVQIRSSFEEMTVRLEREMAESHDTAEKVGRLDTTVKDMFGSAGRWVDSEHLETVITSLRRDVKDMQDRGHKVVVDAVEELARNKADRKELYKALKDPSSIGMRKNGSVDPSFKREILDGLGARLHGRNGEEPNFNGLLTAGRFDDGENPSPQRMRPKSAGPATHRVRRRLPDPYEVEEGTPKVIHTGPIPSRPSPTTRREVRTVVAPGGGGSSNSALLKSASSSAVTTRPVNGRPGQDRPESSGSFEVNVPRIGQTLSSTPVALAAMEDH